MRSLPGQFALVRLPAEMDDKPLGILNVPGHPQVWEFLIPLGDGTKAAFAQADTLPSIAVDGPYGTAYYRSGTRFPVCVADSEGLAQASRIARAAMSDPDCELLTVLIAGASVDDPVCGVLFDGLHGSELPIDLHSLVFAGDTTEAQRARQVGEALRANIQSPAERSISEMAFYLFGSARMVAGCRRVLSQEPGIPTANVHFDAYY